MRELILRSTASIISRKGLNAASTRAICDAVGITPPTLYYYFENKAKLVDAVSAFAFELHREAKSRRRTPHPIANLRIYWDEFIGFCIAEPELQRAMILALTQGRMMDAGFPCFNDLVTEFVRLEATGKLTMKPLKCARTYLAAALGLSILVLASGNRGQPPSLSASTRDLILAGLVKPETNEQSI